MRVGGASPVDEFLRLHKEYGSVSKFQLDLIALGCGASSMGVGITDSVFIQDQNRHGRSILDRHNGDARAVERLRKALASHGYKLKPDDHYIPTVAKHFGDPRAIVSHTQGLADLRKTLHERGESTYGEIEVKGEARGPRKPKHALNPAIVERIRQRKIQENPDLARKDQRELRHEIAKKHGKKIT